MNRSLTRLSPIHSLDESDGQLTGSRTIVYQSKYRIVQRTLQSTPRQEVFAVRMLLLWLRRGRSGNNVRNLVDTGE